MKMRSGTTLLLFVMAAGLFRLALPAMAQASAGDAGGDGPLSLETLRDPFWPVGWEPPPKVAPTPGVVHQPKSPIRWDEARKHIRITGLSKTSDGDYFAILKKIGVVEAGDVVAVTLDDLVYRWRVTKITNKGIVPEKIGVFPKK